MITMDNAASDLLEILPSKMNAGDAEVVAAATISMMTAPTIDEIATQIITMRKEEIDIPRTDEKSSGAAEVEGAEVDGEEEIGGNSHNNHASGHPRHPWILGQPISPAAILMKILCA